MSTRRNEKCPCGSGTKYKKCCLNKEIKPYEVSATILDVIEIIRNRLSNKKYNYVDLTDGLTVKSYMSHLKKYYNSNTVCVAERTELNEAVFASRTESKESDIMVMWHGGYRTFNYYYILLIFF